ncbi:MAG: hypothetical protein ACE5KK_05900 [Candidatus Brocadiales bacterium]
MYRNFLIAFVVLLFISSPGGLKKAYAEGIGQRFHQETALGLKDIVGSVFRWRSQPPLYKAYLDKKRVRLPMPAFKGKSVEDAIRQRRSVRDYSGKEMTIEELAQLVYAAGGITTP